MVDDGSDHEDIICIEVKGQFGILIHIAQIGIAYDLGKGMERRGVSMDRWIIHPAFPDIFAKETICIIEELAEAWHLDLVVIFIGIAGELRSACSKGSRGEEQSCQKRA